MAVAAAEQVLLKHRRPPAPQQRRHQNGLRVGGEAGIGRCSDRAGRAQTSAAPAGNPGAVHGNPAARLSECRRHGGQVFLPRPPQENVAPGGRRRAEIGSRRNAVRDHGICTAVEGSSTPDHHGRCTAAGNLPAAGIQEILKIFNLRLAGRIGKHRNALRPAGGQHQVFRRSHGGEAQYDLPPRQLSRLTAQGAAGVVDLRSQHPQAGEVQINGSRPQLTAAGAAEGRLPAPGQNRSQKDDGGAHLPHQRIRNPAAGHPGGIHRQGVSLPLCPAPQRLQNADGCFHIPQMGTPAQLHRAAGQDGGCQHRQYAVLRALDGHFPLQTVSAPRQKLAHIRPS